MTRLLAAALLLALLAPAASAARPPLVDVCVRGFEWCDGLACVTVSRQVPICVDGVSPEFGVQCYQTGGGLDYHSYTCVDPGNPRCPVYTLTHSDEGGIRKTCFPA